ncbi:LysR family transcriptional regulator [Muribacter muris]|uniref:LysR family transcriptional regulator n=1 Tax=Muribacter muris TaxID=67855 RepID=A0A4Y9JWN1_9PAST|nr:LysR family transcriptional regulator [Muribacter muris]MBF0785290.1 LysR family transcriptional regulator [Muribacter muris]MBF0826304.1 LysR family transcriptional regulator [Muribacter muris]TFV09692.1 LysR family transcriptional regulator [Muribacter muris]
MNLNALRLFVAVVQDGSLSKAAHRLSVPIATLSRQMTELEKSFNIQLFDRQKTGVKPTMAGQQLYEQIYQSLDNLSQVTQSFSGDSCEISGKLRISTYTDSEEIWAWIDEFCERHSNVSVHLQVTDRVLDLVEDGIDFAFRVGDLQADNVVARPVMTIRTKWLAHKQVLEKYGTPDGLDDLVNFPIVGWAKPDHKYLQIPMGKKVLNLPYIFSSNDVYAIANAIKNGRGIGLLSEQLANHLINEHNLVEILADSTISEFTVHLLYVKHRHQSALKQAFLDFIKEKTRVERT